MVGPGITATKVYVGYTYSSQAKQADAALGASSGATPSYSGKDVYDSVIKWANEHGGFHGRQMVGIGYDVSLTGDISQQEQAACDTWTKDNKVFALVGVADITRACAEKAGAVSIQGFNGTADTFRRFPHFVDPSAIRLDREGPVTVGGLKKAGYFTGRFGFVTWDDPSYHYAYEHGYVPAYQRAGVTETDRAFITVPQQVSAISDTSAAVQSAIAKFRSEGIDHVILQDGPAGVFSGAGLTFEWMNQAKSQQYFPRYGENSLDSPGYSALPPDEENNLLAISEADTQPENDADYHSNPARDLCFKIESDAGYPVSPSNTNDEGIAAQICDFVFFVQKVMNSLGNQLTNDAFVQAVSRLGTSYQSPFVYGTRFPAGVRDGADLVRTLTYQSSCQCLKYLSAPYQPD